MKNKNQTLLPIFNADVKPGAVPISLFDQQEILLAADREFKRKKEFEKELKDYIDRQAAIMRGEV